MIQEAAEANLPSRPKASNQANEGPLGTKPEPLFHFPEPPSSTPECGLSSPPTGKRHSHRFTQTPWLTHSQAPSPSS